MALMWDGWCIGDMVMRCYAFLLRKGFPAVVADKIMLFYACDLVQQRWGKVQVAFLVRGLIQYRGIRRGMATDGAALIVGSLGRTSYRQVMAQLGWSDVQVYMGYQRDKTDVAFGDGLRFASMNGSRRVARWRRDNENADVPLASYNTDDDVPELELVDESGIEGDAMDMEDDVHELERVDESGIEGDAMDTDDDISEVEVVNEEQWAFESDLLTRELEGRVIHLEENFRHAADPIFCMVTASRMETLASL